MMMNKHQGLSQEEEERKRLLKMTMYKLKERKGFKV